MQQRYPGKLQGTQVRGDCPHCGGKDTFVWANLKPHPFECKKCGKKGNCYTEDYVDPDYSAEKKPSLSLTRPFDERLAGAAAYYRKVSKKNHRLSPEVLEHFGVTLIKRWSKQKSREYEALCLNGSDGKPAKWLARDRWFNFKLAEAPTLDHWHNLKNLDSTAKTVYVTAGEWDLFAFWEHTKLDAISPKNGESHPEMWKDPEPLDVFRGKEVVILYDNDTAGRAGARNLAEATAAKVKTKSIKIVDMNQLGVPAGGDLDDYFNKKGGDWKRLQEVIEETPPYNRAFNASTAKLKPVVFNFRGHEITLEAPYYPDTTLTDKDLREGVWRTGFLTSKAARRKMYTSLAVSELGSDKGAKDRVKDYGDEFEVMHSIAVKETVRQTLRLLHMKGTRPFAGSMDRRLYYYYDSGVYRRMSDEEVDNLCIEISDFIVPKDDFAKTDKVYQIIQNYFRRELLLLPTVVFDENKIKAINFKNGLLEYGNGKPPVLKEHSPDYLSTFQIPYDWRPELEHTDENFAGALGDWFFTESDQREFLKLLGYTIAGERASHKVAILYGGGNNGKGEVAQLIREMIGPLHTSDLQTQSLSDKHVIANLHGKLVNIADESNKNERIKDGVFKTLTGGGWQTANPKYKDAFSFKSKAIWFILTNNHLTSSDNSYGMMRRLKYVQFKEVAPGKIKKDFCQNFLKPEMEAIIVRIVREGLLPYLSAGFEETETDRTLKREFESRQSVNAYWQELIEDAEVAAGEGGRPLVDAELIKFHDGARGDRYQWIDVEEHYKKYCTFSEENGFAKYNSKNFRQDSINYLQRWMTGLGSRCLLANKPKYDSAAKKTKRRLIIDSTQSIAELWSQSITGKEPDEMDKVAIDALSGEPSQPEDASFEEYLQDTFKGRDATEERGGLL